MKRFCCILTALLVSGTAFAQHFSDNFEDATLRLDYIFSGNAEESRIALAGAYKTRVWAGRRSNMDKVLLEGNGKIEVLDPSSGKVLYCNPFSTLFQEWQSTAEARQTTRAFENCFQVPWPRRKVNIRVTLTDKYRRVSATLTHPVDPSDILIRPLKAKHPWRQIQGGGHHGERIDVAIIGDGYSKKDIKQFYTDASNAVASLMGHKPLSDMQDRFNFIAVAAVSDDSGVSVPHENKWMNTCFSSHYDTFYTERYLTTSSQRALYFDLAGIPFEHIIILANTSRYGGGGIFNSLTIVSGSNRLSGIVTVHEFGHAFAGLADEYFYDDEYSDNYPQDVEPWEPNITTKTDFSAKWKAMMDSGVPGVGLYEGGGYRSKGIFRPAEDCRMKTNEFPDFCPVCRDAIIRTVDYYTGTETK